MTSLVPGDLLRQARQLAGLSQRGLAEWAGVGAASVANVEAGARGCSVAFLDGLLRACGLTLALSPADEPEVPGLAAHLALSTSQRLMQSLGGTGEVCDGPWPPAWVELHEVVDGAAAAVLEPAVALPVWLPGLKAPMPIQLRLHQGWWPRAAPGPLVEVLGEPDADQRGLVPVGVGGYARVLVPSPLALALDDRCATHAPALRVAARLLAASAARDEGGRRAPAHRSPDESQERDHLLRSLTFAMHRVAELPQPVDSRGWRLEQPVSLRQWLIARGLPPRAGSRRRW